MLIEIFDTCRSRTWTARSTISEVNCKYSFFILSYIIRIVFNINTFFFLRGESYTLLHNFSLISFHCSMKPTLKKVSKYENKFAKLQKKAAEFNFRNQLKQVKKKEFTLEEEDKEVRTTVFNRIFAFKRREYFFRKLVFSLPVKSLLQVFF